MHLINLHSPEANALMDDMAKVLSQQPKKLTEIAVAKAGGSVFSRASYFAQMTGAQLAGFAKSNQNVAFVTDIDGQRLAPPYEKPMKRQTKNEFISEKSVISFDLDFKDSTPEYPRWTAKRRREFAKAEGEKIIKRFTELNIPVWLLVFSGGGLHLHFKAAKPLLFKDSQSYRNFYKHCSQALGTALEVKFDPACCNLARLMRLPLSTNYKNAGQPVATEVWHWKPQVNAREFLSGLQVPEAEAIELDFEKVLQRFGYNKFESFQKRGEEIVCSSPFSSDSKPSFYFHPTKKVFFDFSTGKGGHLSQLLDMLSKQSPKVDISDLRRVVRQNKKPRLPNGFEIDKQGVWWLKDRGPDQDPDRLWVCAPLRVVALTRDLDAECWGRVLEFTDSDGNPKEWTMPVTLLAGDGQELRSMLLSLGLTISLDRRMRTPLMEYILRSQPQQRFHSVEQIGWHKQQYILPDASFGGDQNIRLQGRQQQKDFQSAGSLEEWKTEVAGRCKGQSRLMMALATAFAPVTLQMRGAESGGFHFVGASSIGKTLTLKAAASVWGSDANHSLVRKWRSTVNGLEHLAESSNDALLILDELAEVSPKAAGQAAYMLANGCGKQRLNKDGKAKRCARWRTLFLSSGEIGLAQHLGDGGEQVRGGQHIRLVDLEADAGKGHGVFDYVPEGTSASELADTLTTQTRRFGGSAIRSFLTEIVKDSDALKKILEYERRFLDLVGYAKLTRQSQRVAKRFALVAASGCYAVHCGVLPWSSEEGLQSVAGCFFDWHSQQPKDADFESSESLKKVRHGMERHVFSHFPELGVLRQGGYQGQCAGFREKNVQGHWEWYVMQGFFKDQICAGLDHRRVEKVLLAKGVMRDYGGRRTKLVRIPGVGPTRTYHLGPELFGGCDLDESEGVTKSDTGCNQIWLQKT